ncbi:protein FAR1-RELATED SEQUENCE 5-like [Salvia miltiorrhiza]|uniref:protein FAR1-RELATED SEQUENCE 5-like n=1 Tax=Salvia miltiorrhiza TaxID=226208 RepID=UPI0025ACF9E6|nr:protein FAR1-RELATED SEQUENCE 5-like [Salvia miltiorrhiza]
MSASDVIEESATDVVGEAANTWFPECDDNKKHFVGQIFNDLVKAVKFYSKYAKACGFVSRKSTKSVSDDGTIRSQYVLCNREGSAPNADRLLLADDYCPKKKCKRSSCKVGCEAKIIFQIMSYGRYYVRIFIEGHNHKMVLAGTRHLLPSNRKIEPIHQYFIHAGIKANFGPMRTFRMYAELVGGFDKAGCTSIDFKNYVRDLKVHIVDSDAHMLLDTLKNKKDDCEGFQYFYDVDDENQLSCLIWTDQQSVNNYKNFGEVVSFDATYCTNRYKLIFTPFTGRDNHGKCVSFGAAIISREDMDLYAWVLKKFTECVGKAPRVFMTDQDPGLKKAVAHVWPETHHRFCMWHITIKVAEKLPPNLRDDSEFKTKFGKIVWSDLNEPAVFEENWMNLMNEYELNDNRWFSDMYADRSLWIPAYFRDISMSGLFRTTSMSESENSYFKRFLGKNSNLSVFYMNYDTALDS